MDIFKQQKCHYSFHYQYYFGQGARDVTADRHADHLPQHQKMPYKFPALCLYTADSCSVKITKG